MEKSKEKIGSYKSWEILEKKLYCSQGILEFCSAKTLQLSKSLQSSHGKVRKNDFLTLKTWHIRELHKYPHGKSRTFCTHHMGNYKSFLFVVIMATSRKIATVTRQI